MSAGPRRAGLRVTPPIHLRRARADDIERLFRWRNLPELVALSSSQRSVSWEEHRAWFERITTDPAHLLLIVVVGDEEVGQVRFDTARPRVAEVSTYLLPGWRGTGFGVEALRHGCSEAFRTLSVDTIEALIRKDNERSLAAFARAGFSPTGARTKPDHVLLAMRSTTTPASHDGRDLQ
jgi:RimJ/RimL family protein N-acetyltransferase